ncbi:hypothetical protein PSCICN_33790 [Pseudomonas cichorii]|nr:hypothetical protein PSCICN_33790 [Pseudomonas cichorii]
MARRAADRELEWSLEKPASAGFYLPVEKLQACVQWRALKISSEILATAGQYGPNHISLAL